MSSEKVKKLISEMNDLTLMEASALIAALREKLSLPIPAENPAKPHRRTYISSTPGYDIELIDCGPDKISVIKIIRGYCFYSLKEAKELAENVPVIISGNNPVDEKESFLIKEKLEEAGAVVKLHRCWITEELDY